MTNIGRRLDCYFRDLSHWRAGDVVANCLPRGHEWHKEKADVISCNPFDVVDEIFNQERSLCRISTTKQLPLRLFHGGLTLIGRVFSLRQSDAP